MDHPETNSQPLAHGPSHSYPMDNMPRKSSIGGKERAPSSRLKRFWQTLLRLSHKEHSLRQDPPQSSNSQASGICDAPNNQYIPSYQQLPILPQIPSYPAIPPQIYMDVSATLPAITTGYDQSLPQWLCQQAPTLPPPVIPSPEIIIALMGVTGKVQNLTQNLRFS